MMSKFRLCRVLRDSDGVAMVREIRRHRYDAEVLDMSDRNWISPANAQPPRVGSEQKSNRFWRGSEQLIDPLLLRRKRNSEYAIPMPLRMTLGATQPPRCNTILRRVIGLLRRWRERGRTRPQLCELDDHILQDIGLTRDALLREATGPLWR